MANETIPMTTDQVAAYLNVSAFTLAQWRSNARGPKWLKLANKTVRYLKADVDEFVGASRKATK